MTKLEQLEETHRRMGEEIQALKSSKAPVFWEPTNGEVGWYITPSCKISSSSCWNQIDITTGGGYETKELAEKALQLLLATQRLRKAVYNLNKGVEYHFTFGVSNYLVGLTPNGVLDSKWATYKTNANWFYLGNPGLCDKLIASHKDDLLLFLES